MNEGMQDSIEKMKALCLAHGEVISDDQAREAIKNLAGYFQALNEADMRRQQQD